MADDPARRPLLSAELLSIGSELTVGETRDTNAGELARALTIRGVTVGRLTALPDRLEVVTEAVRGGLERADLVISTGGLGPTPDDLTREAIAAALDETPEVDPALEAWLRDLWRRREMPFPEMNLKQAWRIPSAEVLPNPNGTAPGWFVRRRDGRVVIALPGPPREMRPMWRDEALPRLEAAGLGADVAVRTYRLAGIGESQVADRLGETLLRSANPVVATYARVEAVDVRISAIGDGTTSAEAFVERAAQTVLALVGDHAWSTGETTWSAAIGDRLVELGWTLAIVEIGAAGQLASLLGDAPWLRFSESLAPDAPGALAHGDDADRGDVEDSAPDRPSGPDALQHYAARARELGGADVGLALRARPRHGDTAASVVVVTPTGVHRQRRLVFLDGANGRSRAALAAAAILLEALRAG
jgi:nicotinamide-nucleotide amidase